MSDPMYRLFRKAQEIAEHEAERLLHPDDHVDPKNLEVEDAPVDTENEKAPQAARETNSSPETELDTSQSLAPKGIDDSVNRIEKGEIPTEDLRGL